MPASVSPGPSVTFEIFVVLSSGSDPGSSASSKAVCFRISTRSSTSSSWSWSPATGKHLQLRIDEFALLAYYTKYGINDVNRGDICQGITVLREHDTWKLTYSCSRFAGYTKAIILHLGMYMYTGHVSVASPNQNLQFCLATNTQTYCQQNRSVDVRCRLSRDVNCVLVFTLAYQNNILLVWVFTKSSTFLK